MTNSASQDGKSWLVRLQQSYPAVGLSEAFLSKLVEELDSDDVTAIILHGSYARGDAAPYSDVDLVRLLRDAANCSPQKQYFYRDEYLVSVGTRTITQYRERLTIPEQAIFAIQGIREARILVDKEGAFSAFQQEAKAFSWELLQQAANDYASSTLMLHTEYVLKIMRALLLSDEVALLEMALDLVSALIDAIAVQRGVFVVSGNTYFHQVYEAVGRDSNWTRYHMRAAGVDSEVMPITSIEERGIAALHLYRETVQLLRPYLNPIHCEVIERSVALIENTFGNT